MRVVRTAGEVAGEPVAQRQFRAEHRAAHRAHGAPGQRLAPRQAEAAQFLAAHLAAAVALDVAAVVGQGEDIHRAERRTDQLLVAGQAAVDEVIPQQPELLHREAMVLRERRAVVVVIDQWQGHAGGGLRNGPGSMPERPGYSNSHLATSRV
ncbi:hypothetical protein D9M71_397290 [compost metagenome]